MHLDRQTDLTSLGWQPLSSCVDLSVGQVGRKARILARAAAAGFRTPGGNVLPTDIFWSVLERCGAAGKARYLAGSALALDPAHVLDIAAQIAEAMEDSIVDEEAARQAGALFLGRPALPLVCRSSAAMEDGADSAFPGLFTSILNVASSAELAQAIARCWRSVFGADLIRYLLRVRPAGLDFSLALLVQSQVAAPRYGICFSRDPLGKIPGLIVQLSDDGTPDALVHGSPASQSFRFHASQWTGDPVRPPALHHLPEMVSGLSALIGGPVDLEFALDDPAKPPMLFQVRPISRLADSNGSAPMPATRATLPGTSCSPGRATGIAGEHILLLEAVSIDDYARIMSARAIAAVAETSPLGHVAILCRELGIPLVTGLGERLRFFAGELLAVDGDLGLVGLLAQEEDAGPPVPPVLEPDPDGLTIGIEEFMLRCLVFQQSGRDQNRVFRDVMAELGRVGGTSNIRIEFPAPMHDSSAD